GKVKGRRNKTLKVQVAAGIDHGQSFRLRGEGNCGSNGGANGDVIVTVSVKPHPLFQRDGANVLCEMPITFTQAALGAEIEVPTLDGKVRYMIPEGTQTGTTFRLKGKGIPYVGYKNRGDQYVTVVVETPTKLTKEQKDLLKKFASTVSELLHDIIMLQHLLQCAFFNLFVSPPLSCTTPPLSKRHSE